jgi:anti-sigma factor RsiW
MTWRATHPAAPCREHRDRLEPYLDRALPSPERQATQAHLLGCEACRAEFAAAEALERRLRDAFCGEAPPAALWSRIAAELHVRSHAASRESRPPAGFLQRRAVIAGTALLTVGIGLAGWRMTMEGIGPTELMETPVEELRSFIDSGRAVDFATADPVELQQWFVPRVDFAPPEPPMNAGLTLIGGRLCYFFQRRVAAYMYRADDRLLSLYVMSDGDIERPSGNASVMPGGRRAAVREIDGFAHVFWKVGGLSFSLVSNQSASRLEAIARKIMTMAG